jgi:hypothetical protein
MSRKDVEEVVLRPMQRVYLPPRHLRFHDADDPDAKEEALEQYYQALSGYDRAALEKAWQRVRAGHDFSIWPTPARLVQAAELSLPRPRPPSEAELRHQHALDRAEEYAACFMKRRKVARLAREEGWAGRLRAYVHAAAWVQAQLIDGLDREGITLPGDLTRHSGCRSTKESLAWCKEAFAKQVGAGEIDVPVPEQLVEEWKGEAAAAGPAPRNPGLEAILERLREQEGTRCR